MTEALDGQLQTLHEMKRPWGSKHLSRLGKAIRDSDDLAAHENHYDDVMLWYNDLAVAVQNCIVEFINSKAEGYVGAAVTSRSKTIDTLAEKLRRTPSIQLPSVRDIAGVRIEVSMSLGQQTALAHELAHLFGHDSSCIKDLRDEPHSGYRGVHLWLDFAGRTEVQIRTHLQGAWANAYESAGDVFGREIRYGSFPEDEQYREHIRKLQLLSTDTISAYEEAFEQTQLHEARVHELAARLAQTEDGLKWPLNWFVAWRLRGPKRDLAKLALKVQKQAAAFREGQERVLQSAKEIDNDYKLIAEGR